MAAERKRNRDAIRACVARAVARGELSPQTDATALATVFDTFLVGLATEARDGVPPDLPTAQGVRVHDGQLIEFRPFCWNVPAYRAAVAAGTDARRDKGEA